MVASMPGGGCVVDINGGGHINTGARAGERLRGSKLSIAIRKKVVEKMEKKNSPSSRSYPLTILSHTVMTWGNGDGRHCHGDRWGGRDSGRV